MSRRLPVYLVIDCSYSMRGAPIRAVQDGIRRMVEDLRGDPLALETVFLSVITFATAAKQLVPLTDVISFVAPELVAGGKTDLGAALRLLLERIDVEVVKSSTTTKGDWKPVVFILSDGGPSDGWIAPAKQVYARHQEGHWQVLAVGYGKKIQAEKLHRLTPLVLTSSSEEPEALARFLKWASMSVSRSCKVGLDTGISRGIPPPDRFFFAQGESRS